MAKKFVPLSRENIKYRLFLADIRKVYKYKERKLPMVPAFDEKDVSNSQMT